MRYRVHEVLQRLVRILAAKVGLEVVDTPVNSPEVEAWLTPRPGAAWPDPDLTLDDFPDKMYHC